MNASPIEHSPGYDAIVVGARCAGSPTAMLLARRGWRVLLVDRARFPSDTLSTHLIHPAGGAALARWGLLDRLVATGCPPITQYRYDFGPLQVEAPPAPAGEPPAYSPRRIVLDRMLVDAAVEAGAELMEASAVDGLSTDADGTVTGVRGRGADGRPFEARARVVIGADGRASRVAAAVGAAVYHERAPVLASYYAYWSGLPMHGRFEVYVRPGRGFAAMPTHDGQTLVIAGWPHAEFADHKDDIDGEFQRTIALAPAFAGRVQQARRESRFRGASLPGYFRQPFGAGWALVGDAGYHKDPITAQGISDAFLDAERVSAALDAVWRGDRGWHEALSAAQAARDAHALPVYEMTFELATLAPPPPQMQALVQAMQGQPDAMHDFVRMNAGTLAPQDFFAPERVGAIFERAARAAAVAAARPPVPSEPARRAA
jgi:2-polyprenyl-6-methoxyphenol hydroxylase-like FAD-dependent oxidoreductase